MLSWHKLKGKISRRCEGEYPAKGKRLGRNIQERCSGQMSGEIVQETWLIHTQREKHRAFDW